MKASIFLLLDSPVEILLREAWPFGIVFLLQVSIHFAVELRVCGNGEEFFHAYSRYHRTMCVVFGDDARVDVCLLVVVLLEVVYPSIEVHTGWWCAVYMFE